MIEQLAGLVSRGDVVVLSGAGLSTESGIPDYRGPSGAMRQGTPMTYQTFVGEPLARRRYWARSHLGWQTIDRAAPNAGHRAVAELERLGLLAGIITQNVDGLHQKALAESYSDRLPGTAGGAASVVELHGNLGRVVCLGCGSVTSRQQLAERLHAANPAFAARVTAVNPDGDADLADGELTGFRTVDCLTCAGGTLKPDVVFFGEMVPRDRVQHCFALVERARLVLVLGSSLTVMSGRRFVLRAVKRGVPVAIVNQGPTRGDHCATLTLDAPLGTVLPDLVADHSVRMWKPPSTSMTCPVL